MTRPGIEPSNDNRGEAAGIAPAEAPKKKGCLKWALAGAVLAGAGLLALSQCSEEPQETPVPPQAPAEPEAPAYQYDLSENTPLQTEDGETVIVERRSCLVSAAGNKVNYGAEGGIEVIATEEGTGAKATGFISPNKLGNLYGGGACTATFLRAAPADAPITTDGPQAFWRVRERANLYDVPDIAAPVANYIADGSCVASTGKVRGGMMEVTINEGEYTFWTPRENYTPAPSHIDAPTCQAKM